MKSIFFHVTSTCLNSIRVFLSIKIVLESVLSFVQKQFFLKKTKHFTIILVKNINIVIRHKKSFLRFWFYKDTLTLKLGHLGQLTLRTLKGPQLNPHD